MQVTLVQVVVDHLSPSSRKVRSLADIIFHCSQLEEKKQLTLSQKCALAQEITLGSPDCLLLVRGWGLGTRLVRPSFRN